MVVTAPDVSKPKTPYRILISYHYFKNVDLEKMIDRWFDGHIPDIFADSGAFSASTQAAPINLMDYVKWVRKWKHLFTVYANLDVIGDALSTKENQLYMEDMGLSPMPAFHTGESWDYLEWYLERYSYIALGGAVEYATRNQLLMPWYIRCFKMAREAGRDTAFHGFGITSWKLITSLKWYSVDSSAWCEGCRFGRLNVFDPRTGKIHKLHLGNKREALALEPLLKREYGLSAARFGMREMNTRMDNCALGALSYMKTEQYIRNRFGLIERKDLSLPPFNPTRDRSRSYLIDEENMGMRLYLADTVPRDFGFVYRKLSGKDLYGETPEDTEERDDV
jgi:hypothetical protein